MERWNACGRRVRGFFRDTRSRACFLGTALFGLLSYLYLFTNLVNNNDMIVCTPWGYGTGLSSGRWMLYLLGETVDGLWGLWNVPIFNGILALALLALASAILARVLELQNSKLCFCLAAITVSVPPIASMMFFAFTIHYYMLALLLMVCAAYLLKRSLLRFAAAVVLIACATGIYQAYLPFLAALLLCFGLSASFLLLHRHEKKKTLLLCLFLLLLPLAANAIEVIAPESDLYTRMTLGLISVFYLPLLLAEQVRLSRVGIRRLLSAALTALLIVIALNYAWQNNGNYLATAYANEKAENYFTTMLTRARSLEGYRGDMQVVFVGKTISDDALLDNWNETPFNYSAQTSAKEQINQYSRSMLIMNYLGYYCREITPEEEARYAGVIAQMETYPNDGSLCIADNLVLIRLE